MTNTEIIFKKNLIALRKRAKLTGYKVATTLNINKSYYYNLEKFDKTQSPTYATLEKIADFYCIKVYELFMEDLIDKLDEKF